MLKFLKLLKVLMKNISKTFLFSLLFVVFSCIDQDSVGHHNTYPQWKILSKLITKDHELVVNVGNFYPYKEVKKDLRRSNDDISFPITINIGGHEVRKRYLEILKERLLDSTLIISATNNFDDSYPVASLPIDGLKFPLMAVENKGSNYTLPKANWLNSNILDIKTGKPSDFNNSVKDKKQISKSQIIALNDSSLLKNIRGNKLTGLYFQDGVTTLLKNKSNAMTILLYHGETNCKGKLVHKIVSFKEAKGFGLSCPPNDPLYQMVKRLPTPESVSLIVSSNEVPGAGFIDGIPVLFSYDSETYLHPILLHKDNRKKSLLLPSLKMCHKFFKTTNDCHYRLKDYRKNAARVKLLKEKGFDMKSATFLGMDIIGK